MMSRDPFALEVRFPMFRRSILMALVGLALAASPALADCQWHSQMKQGTATTSRDVGTGCSVRPGYHWGSLLVTCSPHHHASLTYLFPGKVYGHARVGVDAWGWAKVSNVVKASSSSIQVTLTVAGPGTTQVDSVSVGYYAH
jgi:hypothetical protein